jgi:hypothetical protein
VACSHYSRFDRIVYLAQSLGWLAGTLILLGLEIIKLTDGHDGARIYSIQLEDETVSEPI